MKSVSSTTHPIHTSPNPTSVGEKEKEREKERNSLVYEGLMHVSDVLPTVLGLVDSVAINSPNNPNNPANNFTAKSTNNPSNNHNITDNSQESPSDSERPPKVSEIENDSVSAEGYDFSRILLKKQAKWFKRRERDHVGVRVSCDEKRGDNIYDDDDDDDEDDEDEEEEDKYYPRSDVLLTYDPTREHIGHISLSLSHTHTHTYTYTYTYTPSFFLSFLYL